MPVIKSAKKKARQAIRHEIRNQAWRTKLKTFYKKIQVLSKTKPEEAVKLLPEAFSVVDTACKKHLIHKNNAARKKSFLARTVAAATSGKAVVAPKETAKKAPAKKTAKAVKAA